MIAASKPEKKLSQRERLTMEVRQLIAAGMEMESVSRLLEVGLVFIRESTRDMPGAASRDQIGKWLPDDDDANTCRFGIGYYVPSPDELKRMCERFNAGDLRAIRPDRRDDEAE